MADKAFNCMGLEHVFDAIDKVDVAQYDETSSLFYDCDRQLTSQAQKDPDLPQRIEAVAQPTVMPQAIPQSSLRPWLETVPKPEPRNSLASTQRTATTSASAPGQSSVPPPPVMSTPAPSTPDKEMLKLLPLRYDGKTIIECNWFLSQLRIYWLVNTALTTIELKVQVALSFLDSDAHTWATPLLAQLTSVQIDIQGVMMPFTNEAAFATAFSAHFGNLDNTAVAQVELAKLCTDKSMCEKCTAAEFSALLKGPANRSKYGDSELRDKYLSSILSREADVVEHVVVHPGHKELRPASMRPLEKEISPAITLAAGRKGTNTLSAPTATNDGEATRWLRHVVEATSEAVDGRYDYRQWHTGTRGFALFLKKLPHRGAHIKSIGRFQQGCYFDKVSVLGKTKKTRGGGSTTKKRIRPTSPGPSVADSNGSKKRRVDEPPRPLLRLPLDGAGRLGLEQDDLDALDLDALDLDALDLDDESRGIIRVIREERAFIARRRALLHDMDLDLQKMEKAALAKGGNWTNLAGTKKRKCK
ncbi:predicted protein [Postia placenta Mad-698-R]|nr:predicted protein [Postia placenta Mad-698-R]